MEKLLDKLCDLELELHLAKQGGNKELEKVLKSKITKIKKEIEKEV